MQGNTLICGYLDVKISAKSRRGLTPWKAWQKQWCELKRLDNIENGVELKLKSSMEGSVLNCLLLPRSSTICRTESRTKQYAFGVFAMGRTQKPLLFLSGASESDAQDWIASIRKMLCVASYLPVGESNFHVSVVDNVHSRAAGLVGLHGVLGSNSQEIVISDPCTGDPRLCWYWHQFHQFHFQAPAHPVDDKRIIVMHTSGEFPAGPGQIYLYCEQGSRLLNHLVTRGKRTKTSPGLKSSKRLSRSEGDLCTNTTTSDSPVCIRSQTGSDDSGVRVSIASDDSAYLLKPKTASSLISIGMGVLTKTPGGSETNDDSLQDLTALEDQTKCGLPRRESGVSLASGIYEEISEDAVKPLTNHIYENPIDLILDINSKLKKHAKPPPLPPRKFDFTKRFSEQYKHRCNTLPAKDLSKISQIFTSDSEYVVMSPSKLPDKTKEKSKISTIAESLYMPMSPVISLKNKIENCYMIMNGKK
ncbi:uncharacterized LOC100141786 isoform X1 [Tribolium castaneum]|nr:PREDICTED: uncharacterized LOC100141786 isoform X1 [Tribolium castaneum]|eukprot:XP_008195061.1 PREDICTED: uncharacterized LOC100141786 isoform X1 [Tribolium castaneum]